MVENIQKLWLTKHLKQIDITIFLFLVNRDNTIILFEQQNGESKEIKNFTIMQNNGYFNCFKTQLGNKTLPTNFAEGIN